MTQIATTTYRAFILRVWNEEKDELKQPIWRYVLVDAESEARKGFSSFDQLCLTLYAEITGDRAVGQLMKQEERVYAIE